MKLKKWEELQITDDFLFGKVMRNPDICKRTVEAILDVEIERIEYLEEQKVIDISVNAKSVRFDVYVKDSKNTIYNIEMQPTNRGILPKRSRYYQSMIDLNLIEKGESYKNLNQSFVIFICCFDLFGKNRCIYTFENRCVQETELSLGDGTVKMFLNAKGDKTQINEDLRAFLNYIDQKEDVHSDFADALDREVKKARENKEWRLEYMTLFMKLQESLEEGIAQGLEQGIAQGLEQGIAQGLEQGIVQGINRGDLMRLISQIRKKCEKGNSAEEISEMLEEDVYLVSKIMNLLNQFPDLKDEQIYDNLSI